MHDGTSTMFISSFNVDPSRIGHLKATGVPVVNVGAADRKFSTAINVGSGRNVGLVIQRLTGLKRHGLLCLCRDFSSALKFDSFGHVSKFRRTYSTISKLATHALTIRGNSDVLSTTVSRVVTRSGPPATLYFRRSSRTVPLFFHLRHDNLSIPKSVSMAKFSSDAFTGRTRLAAIQRHPCSVTISTTRGTLTLVRKRPVRRPFRAFPIRLRMQGSATGPHATPLL